MFKPPASRRRAPAVADTLFGLLEDLQVAAWLLPAGDELRAYLELLTGMPLDPDAWDEVVAPWRSVMLELADPSSADAMRIAAAGAVAAATARAARELPAAQEALALGLRAVARASSVRVRRAVG
ncbi:MAG TPA: hypothetical protein VN238_10590 [Solirubrobacteraceae bacterium]|nr:hypothetical protein [Solirubrobacteraceae bacterium]